MGRKTLVVIPSSQYVDFELRMEFGHIPPILLPIDHTNVISKICQLYDEKTLFLLGCHKGKEMVEHYISSAFLPIRCIDVGNTIDVGHTIYKTLLSHKFDDETDLYIHFGDTLVSKQLHDKYKSCTDFIFVSEVNDPWRWTVVKYRSEMLQFIDKETLVAEGTQEAVIGIIKISKPTLFMTLLKKATINTLETGRQSLYEALSEYSKSVHVDVLPIKKEKWIDAGHLDRLNDYRTNMRARSFNSIQLDHKKGVFTKRSENKQKLINEILWYINLPKSLQFCIPRIFDYSIDVNSPYISMDYYGYPSLADIFVHGNLELHKWKGILGDLKWLLDEFTKFPCYQLSAPSIYEFKKQMYVEKVKERLGSYQLSEELEKIALGCTVNGMKVMSLTDCLQSLEESFTKIIHKNNQSFHIMHGDFCLSNILFDSRSNTFRIIDPRGSFGKTFIFGDHYYDIAKLSHSVRGFYDFIVREQFYYERKENEIIFTPYTSTIHHEIANLFEGVFVKDESTKNIINFIEATLFLSMIPLHQDSEKRQIGMLLTGLMKWSSLINKVIV